MKKIIIFGSGDHAKVVLNEILKLKKYNFLGFCDENEKKNKIVFKIKKKNFKILGNLNEIKKIVSKDRIYGIIGISENKIRKKIVRQTQNLKNLKWESIISKDAKLNGNIRIGLGSFINTGTIINTNSIIGNHCSINTGSSIDHDCIFQDYSGTGPGVITGGNVKVGELGYIGIGSIIKNGVNIGKNTIVGAGSLVLNNCLKNSIFFGSPAKKIKKNT